MKDLCGCRHPWWLKDEGFMPLWGGEIQDE